MQDKLRIPVHVGGLTALQIYGVSQYIELNNKNFKIYLYNSTGNKINPPKWVQENISIGASPRGAQALVSAAKVAAVVDGRFAVSRRDIKAIAIPALQHRIVRTFEAETDSRSSSSLIARLLEEVPYFEKGESLDV